MDRVYDTNPELLPQRYALIKERIEKHEKYIAFLKQTREEGLKKKDFAYYKQTIKDYYKQA